MASFTDTRGLVSDRAVSSTPAWRLGLPVFCMTGIMMAMNRRTPPAELIRIAPLPQHVPSATCLQCDVCCRFPERDSFLRPYFTVGEIEQAISRGIDPTYFPDLGGCQVELVSSPTGEGYICPCFDPHTSQCRIYEQRPIDCQIYPLAVMWSVDETQVLLGWDTKCPFLQTSEGRGGVPLLPLTSRPSPVGSIEGYAETIAGLFERDAVLDLYVNNPRLVGRFQDDVVILRPLPRLTEQIHSRREANSLTPRPLSRAPRLLTLADRPMLEHALRALETPLSAYAFAAHYVWRKHFTFSWAWMADHLCVFAEYGDGIYMPLPPLSPTSLGPDFPLLREALEAVFALMRARNEGSAVSRIENVPREFAREIEAAGYRLTPKDGEYLYRTSDLAELAGDRYKSQRAACNRVIRDHAPCYAPYRHEDREECLELFHRWVGQQESRSLSEDARHLLQDAASAQQEALASTDAWGLVGRVVRIGGRIRAYTFGYARSSSVFCVLFEVADRTIPGLAQFLFRECCREACDRGYASINTMDDSGLEALRISKQRYRPIRVIENFIALDS